MASPPVSSAGLPGCGGGQKDAGENRKCARCGALGCDVRIEPCGCTLHARCTPLTIFADHKDYMIQNRPSNTIPMPNMCCPICQRSLIMGLYIFPLSFRDLEESGSLRRRCAVASSSASPPSGGGDGGGGGGAAAAGAVHSRSVRKRGEGYDDDPAPPLDDIHGAQAAATPFLGLVHSMAGDHHRGEIDQHHSRTGRWTAEEMAFSDHLIRSFEGGLLPVPQGVKLNEFLSDFLMCKSSRLTKKMKNAKLSTRSYTFGDWRGGVSFCCGTLTRLQDLFLESVPTEPVQLELRFNLTRMWRIHLSNLCLQLGYDAVRAEDWLSSLEEMERRSVEAEETVRLARRRKMGLALRKDSLQECLEGVFFGGAAARDAVPERSAALMGEVGPAAPAPLSAQQAPPPATLGGPSPGACCVTSGADASPAGSAIPRAQTETGSSHAILPPEPSAEAKQGGSSGLGLGLGSDPDPVDLASSILTNMASPSRRNSADMGGGRPRLQSDDLSLSRPRLYSEDFSVFIGGENDPLSGIVDPGAFDPPAPREAPNGCGPFLEQVIEYIEERDIPFQHVDVWVPSFMPGAAAAPPPPAAAGGGGADQRDLLLCNAGFASRGDIASPNVSHNLHEFGLYSAGFSFAPGTGMPGRVYVTGIPTWENSIQNASQDHFKRCGGAKLYGIKTVLGIPVFSPTIGRIVVALYSTDDVPRDVDLVRRCFQEFQSYHPEPSWKLVIEMSPPESADGVKIEELGGADGPKVSDLMTGAEAAKSENVPNSAEVYAVNHAGKAEITRTNSVSSTSTETSSALNTHSHKNTDSAFKGGALNHSGAPNAAQEDDDEQQIAALLGEHMPMDASSSTDVMSSFVSLRLLLLRSPDRRSPAEADMIGIIKKSYGGYARTNRRSRADIATLLVKDWMFLSGAAAAGQRQRQNQNYSPSRRASATGACSHLPPARAGGMTHVKYENARGMDPSPSGGPAGTDVAARMVRSSSNLSQSTQRSGTPAPGEKITPLQSRPRSFAVTSRSPISDEDSVVAHGTTAHRSRSVSEDPTSPRYSTANLVPDN